MITKYRGIVTAKSSSVKAPRQNLETDGFSLVELLTVIAIIGIVAAMLLTVLGRAESRAKRVTCINNLREMGIAFHEFADDHSGKYPMEVPVNEGGSQDYLAAANSINGDFYFTYRFFQPLSSFLATPRMLACPNDNRDPETNFSTFGNENLSYFATAFAHVGDANAILAGDRNLTNNEATPQSRLLLTPQDPLQWTAEIHQFKGNILFADDHVEEWNNQKSGRSFNAVMIFLPSVKTFSFDSGPIGGSPAGSPPGAPANPGGSSPGENNSTATENSSASGNSPAGNKVALPNVPMMNKQLILTPPPAQADTSNAVNQFSSAARVVEAQASPATNPEPEPAVTNTGITLAPKEVPPTEDGSIDWWFWLFLLLLLLIVVLLIARLLSQRRKEKSRR